MTEKNTSNNTRSRARKTVKKETFNDKLRSLIQEIDDNKEEGVVKFEDGKSYTKVSYRLKKAREKFGFDLRIINNIKERDDKEVLVESSIYIREEGEWNLIQTAHAHETRDSSFMNTYNYVENAETSAMGRALGGLGIFGEEFASDNEIKNSTKHQEQKTKVAPRNTRRKMKGNNKKASSQQIAAILDFMNKNKEFTLSDILDGTEFDKLEDLSEDKAIEIISYLKQNIDEPL